MIINDLPSAASSPILGPIYMFADDTKIFHVIKSSTDYITLQNDLDSL